MLPALRLALSSGLWNRVVSGVELAAEFTTRWIMKQAEKWPVSIKLSEGEAAFVHNAVRRARTASEGMLQGVALHKLDVPVVDVPEAPNIDGGDPGEYVASVIIKPSDERGPPANVIFSMNEATPFQKWIEKIDQYIDDHGDESPGLMRYLQGLSDNWRQGRADWILPNWLVRRMT